MNPPGRTHQRGVEAAAAAARIGDGWRLDASYTRLHAPQTREVLPLTGPFSGTDTEAQAVRRAKSIASASLAWAPKDGPFSANVTVRYTAKQNDLAFIDPSFVPALVRLKSFTLVNLDAACRLTGSIELFGRVENLFDDHCQELFSYRGQGRGAYGGVRVRL